jgi:hypothetical protein
MGRIEESEFHEHKHDGVITFACFLGSALVGYFIMNYLAVLGI